MPFYLNFILYPRTILNRGLSDLNNQMLTQTRDYISELVSCLETAGQIIRQFCMAGSDI